MSELHHKTGFAHHDTWAEHIRKLHQTRPYVQIFVTVPAVKPLKQGFSRQLKWGNFTADKG